MHHAVVAKTVTAGTLLGNATAKTDDENEKTGEATATATFDAR